MKVFRVDFRPVLLACAALVLLSSACASYRGARLYQSGSHALDRGEVVEAIADLERAAQLVPYASEIQNHLGIAYTEAGRHAAAHAAYQRAVGLDCENAEAQHNLHSAQMLRPAGTEKRADAPDDAPEGEGQ